MTTPDRLPDPPLPAAPADESTPGYFPLRDLVGSTIEVGAVEDLDGIPVVTVDGRRYLCSDDWSAAGATYMQGEMSARNLDALSVRVVEENGHVGFRSTE